jgi:hypothetical protein
VTVFSRCPAGRQKIFRSASARTAWRSAREEEARHAGFEPACRLAIGQLVKGDVKCQE